MTYLIVFLGAGIGGVMRHGTNILAVRLLGLNFPVGTLLVNVIGSFAMAVVVEYLALKAGLPQHVRLFLATGILGGFTTFSTFTLDSVMLFDRGGAALAAFYVCCSVGAALLAFYAGLLLVRLLVGGGP